MALHAAVTVRRPIEEVFAFWSDLSRLPTFMTHLDHVEVHDDGTSTWRARGPGGMDVEWDARVVAADPPRLIAWESIGDGDLAHHGQVTFAPAPGDRGTEIRVRIDYAMPGGKVGEAVARLFGEHPRQQVEDDLRRFKQVAETGEVLLADAAPRGTRAGDQLGQRPAEPLPADALPAGPLPANPTVGWTPVGARRVVR